MTVSTGRTYRRGVIAIVVVTVLWRAWTMSHWTWDGDDWVYMADTRSMSFWGYLFQGYKGHLMPAEFLLQWVVTGVAPLVFPVAVAIVALASGASAWVWGRALAALAGPRPALLLPLALITLTPLAIRPTIWWASALQAVPLQLFTGLIVLAALRVARGGSRRDLGWLLLTFVGALAFWEKSVLLVIPAIAVVVHAGEGSLRERVRRAVVPAAAMLVVVAAYAVAYVPLSRSPAGERDMGLTLGADRTPATMLAFFGRGLGDLLSPALAGGPWGTLPLSNQVFLRPPAVVSWGSLVVLALLVGWLLLRRREAWLPLLMAVSYALVAWGLVLYSGRFDVVQLASINDERYVLDSFTVAVLACVMVMARPAPAPATGRTRTAGRVLAGALAVSLVAGNVAAIHRIGTHPGQQWVDTALSQVRDREPVTLVDGYAPADVLPPALWQQDAKLSRMLSPWSDSVSFGVAADQLWGIDDGGRVRKVVVGDAARTEPGPVNDCGYSVTPGTPVTAPMTQGLYALDWVVQVDTFAAVGGDVTVGIGDHDTVVHVGSGLAQHQFAYTGDIPTSLTLSSSPGSGTVCVTDVLVGTVSLAP